MRFFGRRVLLGAALVGVLLVAFSQRHQVDFEEYKRFDVGLNRLGNLDATLNQNVLKARYRLIADYDAIPEQLEEMKRTMTALVTLPSFVPKNRCQPFLLKLNEFARTLAEKEQVLEDFKSQNAVLNNSLRYLPLASRELLESLSADAEGRMMEVPLNRLMQQVLMHCLHSTKDEEPAIRQLLAQLAEWRSQHPDHVQAPAVSRVIAHVNSIISRNPKVEDLTQQIVSLPTGSAAEDLLRLYHLELARALRQTDVVRWILQGTCVLLLLGVAHTIYALDSANQNLERRVAERTIELSTENAQRKNAEAGVRKSERFLQSTLDALSAHIAMLDAEGTIVAVNAAWKTFAESNGILEDAFGIGANYLTVCDSATGPCAAEATSVSAGIRRVMDGEETEFQVEYPCHSPTEERWFIARITRFRSADSLSIVVTHENVTARAQAEQHLRKREAELRVLFDFLPAMICFKDTENRILRANRFLAQLFGKPIEQIEGQPSSEIYSEEAARIFADDMEVIRSGQPKLQIVEKFCGSEGPEFWIETDKIPVCDQDGKVIGLVVMAQDITARRQAEAELKQVHMQLLETSRHAGMAEVATGVLHNVGNVLNSVNVSATLVAEGVKKSKAANLGRVVALLEQHAPDLRAFLTSESQGKNLTHYLRQLHERLCEEQRCVMAEVESLQRNIEHIKDIVSMQQEYAKVSGVTEILKVADLVEDSLRMNSAALARHSITVERNYEDVSPIAVEKHKALQILVNLIRNAKYACDESGQSDKRLTLRVASANGLVKISVSDNGVGIPPENLTRIFNHGFTTRKDGHGFGLHSGALAATEMGGALRAHSDGPGLGATFTLDLPLVS